MKQCKCGETDQNKLVVYKGRLTNQCRECQRIYTKQRKRDNKKLLVEHMGGCCSKCKLEYHQSIYEFHHLDPDKKDPTFSYITSWALDRAKKELENCDMVCRNCHFEIHNEELYV